MQYYNNLFPPITTDSLPSFNAIPQCRNSYTNAQEINYFKFPFYHSIANTRSQFKSIVLRVVRGDNNGNPIDEKLFKSKYIVFRALDKTLENDVITDQTGETYVKFPSSYLLTYRHVVDTEQQLSSLSADENQLAYVFSNGKVYIRKSSSWEVATEKNYNYPNVSDIYYKIQIRLLPYEVKRTETAGSKNEWKANVNGAWELLDDNFLNKYRDFISEYSTITVTRPTYNPDLKLIGSFSEVASNGDRQPPIYNENDDIVGDGINDSINIVTSSFFEFIGAYFNARDMKETLSKYKFIIRNKINDNPLDGIVIDESNLTIVDNPDSPSIKWQNKRPLQKEGQYWLELQIETKNGYKTGICYWIKTIYPEILSSAGLEVKQNPMDAKIEVKIDGTQILFIPENGVPTHEFIGEEEAKFTENYITSRDINLDARSGVWCSQLKATGITPNGKPFLTIKSPDINPIATTQYVYELSAVYDEKIVEQTTSSSVKIAGNLDNHRMYIDSLNRLTFKTIYTEGVYPQGFLLKDSTLADKYWKLKIVDGRMEIEDTLETTTDTAINFARYNDAVALKIMSGRIVLTGSTLSPEMMYTNHFVLNKKTYTYNVADKKIELVLDQSVVARFLVPDTRLLGSYDKIDPSLSYYFYIGDEQGYPILYVAQLLPDSSYLPSYDNQ